MTPSVTPSRASHAAMAPLGRAGDDAVVVVRVPLRLHQPLPSSGRTADEVRQARRIAVEGFDDGLRLDGGFVDRAIAEIDHQFRMSQRP
jgi:hypothetical protein